MNASCYVFILTPRKGIVLQFKQIARGKKKFLKE